MVEFRAIPSDLMNRLNRQNTIKEQWIHMLNKPPNYYANNRPKSYYEEQIRQCERNKNGAIKKSKICLSEKIEIIKYSNDKNVFNKMKTLLYAFEMSPCGLHKRVKNAEEMFSIFNNTFVHEKNDVSIDETFQFMNSALQKGREIQDEIDKEIQKNTPRFNIGNNFEKTYTNYKNNYYAYMKNIADSMIQKLPLNRDVFGLVLAYL